MMMAIAVTSSRVNKLGSMRGVSVASFWFSVCSVRANWQLEVCILLFFVFYYCAVFCIVDCPLLITSHVVALWPQCNHPQPGRPPQINQVI